MFFIYRNHDGSQVMDVVSRHNSRVRCWLGGYNKNPWPLALCSYFQFHKSIFIKIQDNIYLHYYEYSLLIEDFMQFELSIATLLRFPKLLIIIELHKFINTPHV
jgi:hypothetical protein